jgi:cell wall-associated NlpC family hydrolase
MPRYSAEQIYGFARQGGFSPDEATTMTAIALAESGGNSRSHNAVGENSQGLWQINAKAHPALARKYDLFDPVQNARAAHEVSRGGTDISPWTVTHGGSSARYLHFRADAQAAAVAVGDHGAVGMWTGTPGYGHRVSPDGDAAGSAPAGTALERFIEAARDQVGDRYVFGAEAKLSNPDPRAFDCSELTQWAAHQAGATIPDGAVAQYRALRARGLLIPVDEAKKTRGALLFHFDREPGPGTGAVSGAHVAISTGDGRTIEAMNSRRGVVEADAGGRFTYAALIPGISDGGAAPVSVGGADTDRDGLTDANERQLGLDPQRADTDGDTLADGAELVTDHTDPHYADTDRDHLSDAFELAHGLDPTSADADADGHLDGSFATTQIDTDQDGLDDDLEQALELDPRLADTDADGFTDALEVQAHSDPLDAHSTPLPPPTDVFTPTRHDIASIESP